MTTNQPIHTPEQEQEIDLIELAKKFWSERKFILKICGIAILAALIVAFSLPKEYTTTVKLAPEIADASKRMSNLSGLAAMAGVNLSSAPTADAISPDLYPDVVRSIPFLLELFPLQVTDSKKELTTTFYEYMFDHQKNAWWNYIIKAPFQLLAWVRGLFTDENEQSVSDSEIIRLTEDQRKIIEKLQNRISVSVDKKTFVITASIEMQDPVISAQIAKVIIDKLQDYITNYRTQKAKQDYDFTEKAYTDAKVTYYKAQEAYAKFEDANKNIISATYRTEQIRLQNEMSLAFGVYNTLAQQLEQNRLRIQEQTPVYTVIEPATVPLKKSSPRRALILVGFVFLAFCGAIGYLLIKDAFVKK
jgi:uncharacterized protein involved in exopolysaccharide biosynthesis